MTERSKREENGEEMFGKSEGDGLRMLGIRQGIRVRGKGEWDLGSRGREERECRERETE